MQKAQNALGHDRALQQQHIYPDSMPRLVWKVRQLEEEQAFHITVKEEGPTGAYPIGKNDAADAVTMIVPAPAKPVIIMKDT